MQDCFDEIDATQCNKIRSTHVHNREKISCTWVKWIEFFLLFLIRSIFTKHFNFSLDGVLLLCTLADMLKTNKNNIDMDCGRHHTLPSTQNRVVYLCYTGWLIIFFAIAHSHSKVFWEMLRYCYKGEVLTGIFVERNGVQYDQYTSSYH